MTHFAYARLLAFLCPAGLLAGAYIAEYGFGLYPCEMCWWQRYPHFAAVPISLLAFVIANPGVRATCVALAAMALLTSGLIGGYHAGVEYGWWQGLTTCSSTIASGSSEDFLKSIMEAPLIRCDMPQWTLGGISLAGYNFLLSGAGAITILGILWKNKIA